MPWFTPDERELLLRVLEIPPDVNRKIVPALKPLSLYSSELKNLKQVSGVLALAAAGQALSAVQRTNDRYYNTLETHGVLDEAGQVEQNNPAAVVMLSARQGDDNTPTYWQQHSDEIERASFLVQVQRIREGRGNSVKQAWRRSFFYAQQLIDHIPPAELQVVLDSPEKLEVIQYIHSVGTEPWRYFRLPAAARQQVDQLVMRLRTIGDTTGAPDPGSQIELAAEGYASAIKAVQRDIRFRVAGFLRAFVSVRTEIQQEFPRAFPDLELVCKQTNALQTTSPSPPDSQERTPLPLPLQIIVSGCPGSGKSFFLQQRLRAEADVYRCQFHAETSAYDFIGTLKPSTIYEPVTYPLVDSAGSPFQKGRPAIDYRFQPGPLAQALAAALRNPEKNVVLLIEEINRANAPAVFGEIFQLLDRNSGGSSVYGLNVQPDLANHLHSLGVLPMNSSLRLPSNLHIWATMNNADQGVFPLDTAFRRRWSFRYLGHNEPCLYEESQRQLLWGGKLVEWDSLRRELNTRLIKLGIHEDKLIGPYFLTVAQLADPEEVLNKLLLYLWDDVLRFRQTELFDRSDFSAVVVDWNGGLGAPISGLAVVEASSTTAGEEVATSETIGGATDVGSEQPT